jgi:hypothetical protein
VIELNNVLTQFIEHSLKHCKTTKLELYLSVKKIENHFQFYYCDHSDHSKPPTSGTGSDIIDQLIQHIGGFDYQLEKSSGSYQFNFHD